MSRIREKIEPQELSAVLSHYDLGAVHEAAEFARGAHAAPKVLLKTDRGQFLLKRRPRHDIDPFRVAFAHSLQKYLASKNFPLPHLIGTSDDNNSMCKVGDAIYEMYEFIEGEPYNKSLDATHDAGKILGIYHRLVEDFKSEYTPPRGHYHDSPLVYDALRPLGEILYERNSMAGREKELISLLKNLKRVYRDAARVVNDLGMEDWPRQIVHSDWHPGNLLFQGDHVVAVIDYDSARIRPRIMDVSNGCLQFSMVTGTRDLATWEARCDVDRARAFLRGYDEINELSRFELQAAPHLMQEVLLAQAVQPILRTGTFAGLNGYEFLHVVLKKMRWLRDNASFAEIDVSNA